MQWEQEALSIVESIPVPPLMSDYVSLDAERRARRRGLEVVTADVAVETRKGYEQVFGAEAMENMGKMIKGEDVGLPDAFFEQDEGELFSVQLCPVKYGACTRKKRSMVEDILVPVRSLLKKLDITRIVMDRARTPLMSHHVFRVSIIGCPNCCASPYFSDIGIIAAYPPAVRSEKCILCASCVDGCSEGAVSIAHDSGPAIDRERCVACGACEDLCPEGALYTERCGYTVVAGGTGARHPRLARTAALFTDRRGVLRILENAVHIYENASADGRERPFYDIISQYDNDALLDSVPQR